MNTLNRRVRSMAKNREFYAFTQFFLTSYSHSSPVSKASKLLEIVILLLSMRKEKYYKGPKILWNMFIFSP